MTTSKDQTTKLDLQYTDNDTGVKDSFTLKATFVSGKDKRTHFENALMHGLVDEHMHEYLAYEELGPEGKCLLAPPFHPSYYNKLLECSTELRQNIQAMVSNLVGFGWRLEHQRGIEEEFRSENEEVILDEKENIEALLKTIHPTKSLKQVLSQQMFDKHLSGNSYLELIPMMNGKLSGVENLPFDQMRVSKQDPELVPVKVPYVSRKHGYKIKYRTLRTRFRRFAQVTPTGKCIWYKEAGDPRQLNKRTGEFQARVPVNLRATSVMHNKIYSPGYVHGIPVYIGTAIGILGVRESEETNYNNISNNMIPSMAILIENGTLTNDSQKALKDLVEKKVAFSKNTTGFVILEVEGSLDGIPDTGNSRIRIERFSSVQHQDSLYQEYKKNNRENVRQTFRLPPIFVGKSDSFSRSAAQTVKMLADEQVFAPEREDNDFMINRFIVSRWKSRFWKFKSNHPNITDDETLVKIANLAERSGAMNPERMDKILEGVVGGDLGPKPEGIPKDVPYSLTFVKAQKKDSSGSSSAAVNDGSAGPIMDNDVEGSESGRKEPNRSEDE